MILGLGLCRLHFSFVSGLPLRFWQKGPLEVDWKPGGKRSNLLLLIYMLLLLALPQTLSTFHSSLCMQGPKKPLFFFFKGVEVGLADEDLQFSYPDKNFFLRKYF